MQYNFRWQLVRTKPTQDVLDEWNELSENNPDSCASSFAVFSINSHVFLNGAKILYAFAYNDEKMVCAIPFFIKTKVVNYLTVNILQTINHDYLDTYVIAGQNLWNYDELIDSLLQYLKHNLKKWDYFHAHNIICDKPVSKKHQIPFYNKKSAYFVVENNLDINQIISKKLLKNIVREQKKLISDKGSLSLKCSNTSTDIEKKFQLFIELENSGWKSEEKTSLKCDNDATNFYKLTWAEFATLGKAQIYTLYVGDLAIAGALSFKHGSRIFLHKIAYLDSCSKYGAGSILVKLILESALSEPAVDIVCLNTYPEWVKRWHPETYSLHSLEHFNRTPGGIALKLGFGLYRFALSLYKHSGTIKSALKSYISNKSM